MEKQNKNMLFCKIHIFIIINPINIELYDL